MGARSDKQRSPLQKTGTFSITTPTDREIVMTRIFDAPRRVVFEAWTKAEHVRHWWDPTGVELSVCEIDLRPNGAFQWVHGGAGGGAYSFVGAYREITPPERLVFTTRMTPSGPESVGTLVFTEDRGTTTLTMTITCNSIEDRDALLKMHVDAGTARTLANLAEYLHKIA